MPMQLLRLVSARLLPVHVQQSQQQPQQHPQQCDSIDSGYPFSRLASSVISVNGWHELFELHSYGCNID
jgi:hypothetical protein